MAQPYGSGSFDSYEGGFADSYQNGGAPVTSAAAASASSSSKATSRRNVFVAGIAMVASALALGAVVTMAPTSSLTTYMAEVAKAISVNPAKVVGTSRAAHGAFTDMPSATDPTALHDWVKTNYLLYGSWILSAGAQTAPVPSDMPDREPESTEGTRERDYAPIKETGYVIFASFQDPDCKDYFGFMSVQLDKCVASWLGSDAITGPQTYYTVRASVSESMITVTTHMYSDAQCLTPAAPSVNMTTNMACNAWGAHDQVLFQF